MDTFSSDTPWGIVWQQPTNFNDAFLSRISSPKAEFAPMYQAI